MSTNYLEANDNVLEAIAGAKRELLRVDPPEPLVADLNVTYASLEASDKAIRRLSCRPSNQRLSKAFGRMWSRRRSNDFATGLEDRNDEMQNSLSEASILKRCEIACGASVTSHGPITDTC